MSKRTVPSRPAKAPQAKAALPRPAAKPAGAALEIPPTAPGTKPPGMRERVLLSLAAGALAAWLVLLALMAFAS
jgi:hypothetical protein